MFLRRDFPHLFQVFSDVGVAPLEPGLCSQQSFKSFSMYQSHRRIQEFQKRPVKGGGVVEFLRSGEQSFKSLTWTVKALF